MPDAADLHADTGTAIGAAELNALFSDVEAGLKAIMLRASNGLTALEKNYAAIGTLQKAAATKRIVDVDPQVKTLLQSADAQFKEDAAARESRHRGGYWPTRRNSASAEFARLRTMLEG